MKLKILYEDNHLIAVDKEPGVLSQGDITGEKPLVDIVKEYIKNEYQKPGRVFLGLVHRLDKDVSGVMVFAKTTKSARRLHSEFTKRSVIKIYVALVERFAEKSSGWTELANNIIQNKGFSEISSAADTRSKKGIMRFMVVDENDTYSLILIQLLTGRKHQIRAQLSAFGYPVIGDAKYGSGHRCSHNAICLHALCISFMHPAQKKVIKIFSEIPNSITERFRITDSTKMQMHRIIESDFFEKNKG